MSNRATSSKPNANPSEWIGELLRTSAKPKSERRVGIEIERIAMWPDGLPFLYRETAPISGMSRPGAGRLLQALAEQHDWPMIKNDEGLPLGFSSPFGKVSLEPGSQLEISTDPGRDLLAVIAMVDGFDAAVTAITNPWNLKWLGIGVNPFSRVNDIDVIPSNRYQIMTDYLGGTGELGTTMMRLTSSVQINLDYHDENDGIDMLRTALMATPVSYALFGNSPLVGGKDSGYLSYRNLVWENTDAHRTGLLNEAFDSDFSFDRYAELAWHRPLMFAQDAAGHYLAAHGNSLEDIGKGKLAGVVIDETNKINSIRELFMETRLKPGYVEIRSIDGLRTADRNSAAAFWIGLLYSDDGRKKTRELLGKLSNSERLALHRSVAKEGLRATIGNLKILDVAKELVAVSRAELKRRGYGEDTFLQPIEQSLEERRNPADRVLSEWHGQMKEKVPALVQYLSEDGN